MLYFMHTVFNYQGDQVGPTFAQRAIVYFGHFLKIAEVGSRHFCGAFFQSTYKLCINSTKHEPGYILGVFSVTLLLTHIYFLTT
jgi:hypothetical protein